MNITIPDFHGIVRTDDDARAVYAEGAGIARIMPRGIIVPRDADDVVALVRWAADTHTPLIPRGSGSGMAGGAIGNGLIVDLSRMRAMGAVDVARKRIHVEPGVLRNDVDRAARAVGLRFPPDPSSGAFCTVGGMVSTNAAGAHSLKFGATRAWVTALDCVFNTGHRATLRRGAPAPEGIPAFEIFAKAASEIKEQVRAGEGWHPGVRKESAGYGVHAWAETGDVVDLLVGSEGTLAIIVGIELALTEVAGATSSVLGAFPSLDAAVAAAIQAREAGAAACELLDRTFLDVAARHATLPNVPEGTEAVLLADVEGENAEAAKEGVERLRAAFERAGASRVTVATSAVDEVALWELRHAASPTLATLGPTLTSMQFIEDGCVPPERLGDYIRGIRKILASHGILGVIFGHAGDAHVHVNPLIDVSRPDWRDVMERVMIEGIELTAALGGTLAGEHGDGRLRTPFTRVMWNEPSIIIFWLIKHAFDYRGIFNRGVKLPDLVIQRFPKEIKYDPTLPPLPPAARAALDRVTRERAYQMFRLDLLDQTP